MADSSVYADTFALMDTDGDGLIDAAEFTQLMQAIGGGTLDPEVGTSMFGSIDTDGDGKINLAELTTYLGSTTA